MGCTTERQRIAQELADEVPAQKILAAAVQMMLQKGVIEERNYGPEIRDIVADFVAGLGSEELRKLRKMAEDMEVEKGYEH
jgi:signal transduction histidine kinase